MADLLTSSHKSLLGLAVASALAFLFSDCVFVLVNYILLGLGGLVVLVLCLHIALGSSLRRAQGYISDAHKKAVFITGCDTGFGHRLARRLAHMSFTVYAGCLCPEGEGAQQLARDRNIKVLTLDVTNQDDVDACVASVKEDLQRKGDLKLWSVVNNAGILHYGDLEFTTMTIMRRTYDVNTLGAVCVTRAFLPLLREAQEGRVVNVISVAGRTYFPGLMAYCMSKHAGIAFSDGLRHELQPWNVTVHSIEPGCYQTSLVDSHKFEDELEKTWPTAPPEVRTSYGEDFYRARFHAFLTRFILGSRGPDKIFEVIDDLAHAVAAEKPKRRYVPNWHAKLNSVLRGFLPAEVYEFLAFPRTTVKPRQVETSC